VGQLPQEIAPATLSALFGHYGTVVECDVVRDSEMGVGKGFAFLTMGSSAEAATAMHSLNGYLVAGKRLQVAVKVRSFLFVARSKGGEHMYEALQVMRQARMHANRAVNGTVCVCQPFVLDTLYPL
jgi:RNA recognition motif-containing protein